MTTELKDSEGIGIDADIQETCQKSITTVYVDQLNHPEFDLRHPLPISVEKDKQSVIANYPQIESFGCGSNEAEAISDLLSEIIEIYIDLEQGEAELSSLSKKWWNHLRSVVIRK